MRLTEVLIRCKALKHNIEQLKLRLTNVAKIQEGDIPAERPQELLAALEAGLEDLQASIIRSNRTHLRATLPSGTTLMQGIVQWDHPNLQRGILDALMTSVLPVQDRYTYAAKARSNGRCSETTYSGRSAIHCLRAAGRHLLEGGLRHVPAVAGSAHSQAPPIPHVDDAGN